MTLSPEFTEHLHLFVIVAADSGGPDLDVEHIRVDVLLRF
jgi:hypothetical protein